jgi:hypothetical protein
VFFGLLVQSCAGEVTFYKDVLPILQKRCQSCHRPGEIGPMPLLTYRQVRPWAAGIREAVTTRKMPPWFEESSSLEFANNPSLASAEIKTVQSWVDSGSAEGIPTDAPPAPKWPNGWNISSPDVVIEMPKPFVIPAKTEVDYQYVILKLGFAADRWIQMAEIRPGDRSVVHHAVLYVREPGSDWLRDVPPGVVYAPPHGDREAKRKAAGTIADILAIYTPGSRPAMFPAGMGKKIPAGSDLVLQIHYTARDKTIQDVTSIGLVMCADQPKKRVLTLQMGNDTFVIPPGERNYRVAVSGTMPRDAMLLSLFPHMHLRGSAFEYQIAGDGGRVETLLRVKPYDFFWQLSYELQTPRLLRAGTRLLWVGYFDNSADNPKNPDPTAEVSWGEQSREEMMIGFFDIAVPGDIDKTTFFVRK